MRSILITVLILILNLLACGPVREGAGNVADDAIDCTSKTAQQHAAEYGDLVEQIIRSATAPDGSINWQPVKAAAVNFGTQTGWCVIAATVARLLTPPSAARGLTPEPVRAETLRAGWDAIKRERWGAKTFVTPYGTL